MHVVITEEAAKAKAKALRLALADKGITLNNQACLDVIARVEGEKNWPAMNAKQNQQAQAKAPAPAVSAAAPATHFGGISLAELKKRWTSRPPKPVNLLDSPPDPTASNLPFEPSYLGAGQGRGHLSSYPHHLVFVNPEGNPVHRDWYKTKAQARAAAVDWGLPSEGFCTEYTNIMWPEPAESGEFTARLLNRTVGPDSEVSFDFPVAPDGKKDSL